MERTFGPMLVILLIAAAVSPLFAQSYYGGSYVEPTPYTATYGYGAGVYAPSSAYGYAALPWNAGSLYYNPSGYTAGYSGYPYSYSYGYGGYPAAGYSGSYGYGSGLMYNPSTGYTYGNMPYAGYGSLYGSGYSTYNPYATTVGKKK